MKFTAAFLRSSPSSTPSRYSTPLWVRCTSARTPPGECPAAYCTAPAANVSTSPPPPPAFIGWGSVGVLSSIGPDPGQDCFFFVNFQCTGETLGPLRSPGISDLSTTNFNDRIKSSKCFYG
ncbi:hypothetical protein DFH09DRAFT_1312565 [Mycena vulgaris]|nr:hypothetical protein DFH09DRAFT_1312565 [Mycena vulgaris]